jgi:hypothetical protein
MFRFTAPPEMRALQPGTRFQRLYAAYAEHDLKWLKELMLFAALACFTIGVAFVFASGPAWFFFALAFAIVATQSRTVAELCDRAELGLHALTRKLQLRRAARESRAPLVTAPPAHEAAAAVDTPVRDEPRTVVSVDVSPPHPIQRPHMHTVPYGVVCDVEAQPVRIINVPSGEPSENRPSAS